MSKEKGVIFACKHINFEGFFFSNLSVNGDSNLVAHISTLLSLYDVVGGSCLLF